MDSNPFANGVKAIAVVDPFTSGAMFSYKMILADIKVLRILSRDFPQAQLDFIPKGINFKFTDTIQHIEPNLEDTLQAIKSLPYQIEAVVAGCETGVELSDKLSESLGLPTNGSKLSACRRDKFLMQARLKECGLRSIRQLRVEEKTDFNEVKEFLNTLKDENNVLSCVVKPVRSCGTDQVTFCRSEEDVEKTLKSILGSVNMLGTLNVCAVVQEFIEGTEYVVDSVSCNGTHKTMAIWEYDKINANGSMFVYSGMFLTEKDEGLVDYVRGVLDALGLKFGPSHAEVKMTKTGPCLIEIGCRFHGVRASFMPCTNECIGYNQIDVTCNVYSNPKKFEDLPTKPKLLKSGMQIFLVSPVEGIVKSVPGEQKIKDLKSFRDMNMISCGGELKITKDGWSSPGNVTLVAETREELESHYMEILNLLKSPDFFELA